MGYNLTKPRRRSNSSTHGSLKDFKTKFESVQPDPVFEEEIHGATAADLEKASTASSSGLQSVDDDDASKSV